MKFIYKITNNLNGKVYIGQTNNPKRRFQEHKMMGYESNSNKVLYQAFQKYGLENFSFEIIEQVSNYNEREKYWIQYYNCLVPNGYNMTEGGDEPPIKKGENSHYCTHSEQEVFFIKKILKDTNVPLKDIGKTFNYDTTSINKINLGKMWFDEKENYPLRKNNTINSKKDRALNIINDLLNSNMTQKQIAEKYQVGRTTVTAINNGQNFKQSYLDYPLRKK